VGAYRKKEEKEEAGSKNGSNKYRGSALWKKGKEKEELSVEKRSFGACKQTFHSTKGAVYWKKKKKRKTAPRALSFRKDGRLTGVSEEREREIERKTPSARGYTMKRPVTCSEQYWRGVVDCNCTRRRNEEISARGFVKQIAIENAYQGNRFAPGGYRAAP